MHVQMPIASRGRALSRRAALVQVRRRRPATVAMRWMSPPPNPPAGFAHGVFWRRAQFACLARGRSRGDVLSQPLFAAAARDRKKTGGHEKVIARENHRATFAFAPPRSSAHLPERLRKTAGARPRYADAAARSGARLAAGPRDRAHRGGAACAWSLWGTGARRMNHETRRRRSRLSELARGTQVTNDMEPALAIRDSDGGIC